MENKKKARVIAFYLPQFHPIPENDEWWGKGFTEWTNVGKAKPLFRGHYQPRVPADLGYYDLRLPEVREAQAKLARYAGIEGFCYWHYWFGNGKRLLERPFNEVLESGKPDFPFCLGWANETWSGIWHGSPNKVLMEQTYPGLEDSEKHFYTLLPAFKDKRYIKVNGKPLFYIYRPLDIPNGKVMLDFWNELAIKNGLDGIHFVGQSHDISHYNQLKQLGYNGIHTNWLKDALIKNAAIKQYWNMFAGKYLKGKYIIPKWDYSKISKYLTNEIDKGENVYPTLLSGWDNSPRSGKRGRIFVNYNPETFEKHVKIVLENIKPKCSESNIVFLRAWNEWAEGNYIEPDLKYGWKYLDVLKKELIK